MPCYICGFDCLEFTHWRLLRKCNWLLVTSPCLWPVRRTRLQASNTWAKSPMNKCIHKMVETECWRKLRWSKNMHLCNPLSDTAETSYIQTSIHHTQRKPNAFSHGCIQHVHHFINRNYSCRSKMDRSLILWKLWSATSYVTATFHPTIGQCAP